MRHPLSRRFSSARAFTLIELLVVILVIGILIAVAAPSFLGQTDKANDAAAKQYLTVAYKAAKAYSVDGNGAPGHVQGNFNGFDEAALEAMEPGLTADIVPGGCPSAAAGDPHTHITIDTAAGDDLVICNDPEQRVWTLEVENGVLLPLTLTICENGVCPGGEEAATPPANDDFASALVISGASGSSATISTEGATVENDENLEPLSLGGDLIGHTVWYAWSAPADGDYVFDTWGSTNQNPEWDTPGTSYDSILAVYTGTTLANLTLVTANNDDQYVGNPGGYISRLGLTGVQTGEVYYIQLGGYGEQTETWAEWGDVVLNWSTGTVEEPPPPLTPPNNTVQPSIGGDLYVGTLLQGDQGTWTGTTPIDYSYQWQRCIMLIPGGMTCSLIFGESNDSYELTEADIDYQIRFLVTAENEVNVVVAMSELTDLVTAGPITPSVSYDAAVTSTPSLVGYWRLNDSSGMTADASVGPNGTYQCRLIGTSTCSGQEPVLGQAGAITGDSAVHFPAYQENEPYLLRAGQMSVPFSAALNTDDFTVEAWVKFATGTEVNGHFLSNNDSNAKGFKLSRDDNADRMYLQLGNAATTAVYSVCWADGLTEGDWHYVAASWNGVEHKATCTVDDSVNFGSPDPVFSYGPNSGDAFVAGFPTNDPDGPLDVSLDEVALYNVALPSSVLSQHYQSR